jgi:transcriptional antiterminator NusG
VGDRVKILNGPFSGIQGTIDGMHDDAQNAIVLTILFGRETPTEIAYIDLEKIES